MIQLVDEQFDFYKSVSLNSSYRPLFGGTSCRHNLSNLTPGFVLPSDWYKILGWTMGCWYERTPLISRCELSCGISVERGHSFLFKFSFSSFIFSFNIDHFFEFDNSGSAHVMQKRLYGAITQPYFSDLGNGAGVGEPTTVRRELKSWSRDSRMFQYEND